jgi:cardiolipin synthase
MSTSSDTLLTLQYAGSFRLIKKRIFPSIDLSRICFSTGNGPNQDSRVVVGSGGSNKTQKTMPSSSSSSSEEEKDRTSQATTSSSSPSVWQQLQSIPNIITLARMASTPVLCYWIIHDDYTLAMYGCVLAAISDGLDGYVAKHHGGSTVLGTYLDPLADKALVNGLGVSLWYTGILPTPLILAWAFKDVVLLSGTAWYLYQDQRTINFFDNSVATKPLTVTPTTLGKANTGLQFATLAIGLLTPVASPETLPPMMLQSLCWVTGFTSVGSIVSYAGKSGFRTDDETPDEVIENNDPNKVGKEGGKKE